MSLLRRKLPVGFGSGHATGADARRAMRRAVKQTAARARKAETPPTAIQIVGQARVSDDYRRLRAHWARRARGWGVGAWPEQLGPDEFALFLVPVEPGQHLPSSGRLKPMCMPGFGNFATSLGDEAALAICATVWLETVAPDLFPALALAPPVLEHISCGKVTSRSIHMYGADYPLPAWSA